MNTYTKIGITTLAIPFLLTSCNAPIERNEVSTTDSQTSISSGEQKYERKRGGRSEGGYNRTSIQNIENTTQTSIQNTKTQNTPTTGGNVIEKTSSYRTPSGTITTTFSLGVDENRILTSLNATTSGYDHHDQQYHSRFNAGANMLIGKKIDEIDVDSIGGATLTTEAFMKVIQTL